MNSVQPLNIFMICKKDKKTKKRLTDGLFGSRFEAKFCRLYMNAWAWYCELTAKYIRYLETFKKLRYGFAAFGNTSAEALFAMCYFAWNSKRRVLQQTLQKQFFLLKTIDTGAPLSEDQIQNLGARILSTVNGKENPSTVFVLAYQTSDQRYKVTGRLHGARSTFPSVIWLSSSQLFEHSPGRGGLAKAPKTPETAAALLRLKDPQL